MFENIGPGHGMGWNPASAIGEQQLKRAQSGAAAGSGGKRGAAVEVYAAIGPGSSS